MPVDPIEARLHLLWHDELHPDVKTEGFEDHVRWAPRDYPRPMASAFQAITADLTAHQRFLMKLALRMSLSVEETFMLQSLYGDGRYRSDPNPRLILFCLGRRSGKTEMLLRMARLLDTTNTVAFFTHTAQNAQVLRRLRMSPVEPQAWGRDPWVTRQRADVLLFDEIRLMNGWEQALSRMQFNYIVAFYSYSAGPLRVPSNIPTMAVSVDSSYLRPDEPVLIQPSWSEAHIQEFYPPPLSDILDHEFRM